MQNTKILIKAMWGLITVFIILLIILIYLVLNRGNTSRQSSIIMTPVVSEESVIEPSEDNEPRQNTNQDEAIESSDESITNQNTVEQAPPQPARPMNPILEETEDMVQCSGTTTPKTLCEALISIESNGPKNNPYITIPTDNIPNGATIKFDVSSWQKTTPTTGVISAKARYLGQTIDGTLYFGKFDKDWRVNSYIFEGL